MRFTVLASAALLSACVGQSGSEVIKPPTMNPNPTPIDPGRVPIDAPGIPPRPHCPCDGLRDQQQIRATVLAVESFPAFTNLRRYALRAEEILSDAQSVGEPSLQPGDRFGGYWQGELACGQELQPAIAVGMQVLALYQRGWQDGELCCDYIACGDDCPTEQESDDKDPSNSAHEGCLQQCRTQTADACAQHREEAVMHGDLMLMPWGDEFVVGVSEHGQATITEADLHALTLDRDACMDALDDRFDTLHPAEPPSQDMSEGDPQAAPPPPTPGPGSEPAPSTPPPPLPSTPPMMAQPPGPSATLPDAGVMELMPAPPPGTNTSSPQIGPPPAHPEELRVRCQ